ncbi:MAG: cyclase family protein [Deltaproteobacteria bacterium]|nr:cyclase family protein [Deltaproteobacteria bacterium]
MKHFIELNHVLKDGMMAYPGLPSPKIGPFLDHQASRSRYQDQTEFYLGQVEMVCNLGTYLDSPFHRYRDGLDLSQVPLEKVAGVPGVVFDGIISPDRSVTIHNEAKGLEGKAVLIRTGWDKRWGSESYWEPGPYLSAASIDLLIRSKASLVGVDFWNVDDTMDPSRPVHTKLLASNILIVEHLCNLSALPQTGFRFYAVPLRIVQGASFPVRAFAEIED